MASFGPGLGGLVSEPCYEDIVPPTSGVSRSPIRVVLGRLCLVWRCHSALLPLTCRVFHIYVHKCIKKFLIQCSLYNVWQLSTATTPTWVAPNMGSTSVDPPIV